MMRSLAECCNGCLTGIDMPAFVGANNNTGVVARVDRATRYSRGQHG
jgi:hypothetical protein